MRLTARRNIRWLSLCCAVIAAAVALLIAEAATHANPAQAGGQSLSQLNSQLGANQTTQSNLTSDIASLDNEVASLNRQITLVRSREQDVEAQLADDRARLAGTKVKLTAETNRLDHLRRALKHAQTILSAQLVSSYEQPQQDLVALVLTAQGFSQLLDQLQYLHNAEHSQQQIIAFTRTAKAAATNAEVRLQALKRQQIAMTTAASTQAHALAGMNGLLNSRQTALSHIESARKTALDNARAHGNRLKSAIATIKAQQAAAAGAAARAAAAAQARAQAAAASSAAGSSGPSTAPAAPSSATLSGGWAIPAAVVMCESGGQDLPPNSAGASGYYQIMPATWKGAGGSGPAAYLAPKSEQDAIAARLWNGGAGASNWVCAGIVGIS